VAVRVDDETRAAKTSVPFLALIHPSAWKREFSEARLITFNTNLPHLGDALTTLWE
jgi:hypothetical protein